MVAWTLEISPPGGVPFRNRYVAPDADSREWTPVSKAFVVRGMARSRADILRGYRGLCGVKVRDLGIEEVPENQLIGVNHDYACRKF